MRVTATFILLAVLWWLPAAPSYGGHKGPEVEVGDTVSVPVVCIKLQPALYMYYSLLRTRQTNIVESMVTSCVSVRVRSFVVAAVVLAGKDPDKDDIYTVQLEGPTAFKMYAVVYTTNIVKKGPKNGRRSSINRR